MEEEIMFIVEGNGTGLGWKPVNGTDWVRVGQTGTARMSLRFHGHGRQSGSENQWVIANKWLLLSQRMAGEYFVDRTLGSQGA